MSTDRKKSSKTSNHTIAKKKSTSLAEKHGDVFFFKEIPITEVYIDRLCEDMMDFADLDTTLRCSSFWLSRRMHSAYIYEWKAKWPQLQRAYEYLQAKVAERRDIGALTRKYDGNYVDKAQAMYDPEYKQFLEWKAAMMSKEDNDAKVFQVLLQPAPNTMLVPQRSGGEMDAIPYSKAAQPDGKANDGSNAMVQREVGDAVPDSTVRRDVGGGSEI